MKLFLTTFLLYWLTAYASASYAGKKVDTSKWQVNRWESVTDKKQYVCYILTSPNKMQAYVECKLKGEKI